MKIYLSNKLAPLELYVQKAKSLEKENIQDAIKVYRKAIAVYPSVPTLYDQLGELLIKTKAFDEANECYQNLISLTSQWFKPYLALGQIAAQQNELELAINYYQQSIHLNSTWFWSYLQLGKLWERQGELDKAKTAYETMLKLNPNFPQGYRHLGLIFAKQEKWEQALEYFIKALYIKPEFATVLHNIKQILDKRNQSNENNIDHKTTNIPLNLIKKYMPSIKEWSIVKKTSFLDDVKYIDIYPKAQDSLLPPKSIYQELDQSFSDTEVKFVSSYLTVVDNGLAWADKWRSAIITQNDQLLADISTGYSTPIVASDHLPPAYDIDGKVAFLSSFWGSKGYFHWMLEVLPRVELLRQGGIDIKDIDKFCFYECYSKFNQETLNILGIPREKIIDSVEYPYIQAKQLLVPSIMRGSSRFVPWVTNFLRKEFLSNQIAIPNNSQRIYISRKSKRRIINEAEVECLLAKYGFQSVSLESMSVREQASLLAATEFVIAPHGAGLTNIVFCSPNTKIIEIFSPKYINSCYWYLSNRCNLDYYYLIGENLYDPTKHDGAQDILVNIELLSKTLELSGIK